MNQIVLASNNSHKLDEFRKIFKEFSINILSLKDLSIDVDPDETGKTFLENSSIKATEIRKFTDLPILADDSGLVIPNLDDEPGIFSARYSGKDATDESNRELVLKKLHEKNSVNSDAYFVCALTFLDTEEIQVVGKCHGLIKSSEKGSNGFGYDPIFYVESEKCTFAEMKCITVKCLIERTVASKCAYHVVSLSKLLENVT